MSYHSWGRYPQVEQKVEHLRWLSEIPSFEANSSYLTQGMARSYGDSCLNANGQILSSRSLSRIISFDISSGIIEVESGITLAEILDFSVTKGWFIPVPPGTKFVSVGGAIANDIHGKNHHTQGTFGRHVLSFRLLRSDSQQLICTKDSNSKLFSATIAGLGLTGVILSAKIQLKKIASAFIDSETIQYKGLDEFFELSGDSDKKYEYTAAWIDCVSSGDKFARGIFYRGNHAAKETQTKAGSKSFAIPVPIDFPAFALNKWSMQAFNTFWFHKQRIPKVSKICHYDPFFFPLDGVLNWNRIYGVRGFFQFQCLIPPETAREAIREIIEKTINSGKASFLAVIKQFGALKSPGMLSFPREGTTLTMDFANQGAKTQAMIRELYKMVLASGGSIYPAKDALMTEQMYKKSYPNWEEFLEFKDPKFSSSFWRRVMGENS
ncbi:MAG: FAD-binding oxidoreductase [Bdellovibrionota bacterium]